VVTATSCEIRAKPPLLPDGKEVELSRRYDLRFALLALLLLSGGSVKAQDNPPEMTQKESAPTFQSKVNLVLVPVVVRDSRGRIVADLTKEDFQLSDKGKAQTISSFSVVKRGAVTAQPTATTTPVTETSGAPARPQPVVPERYVGYLFDDLNIEFGDLAYLKKAATNHLANGLLTDDRAAIYTTSGQNNLDFTDDKAKLQAAVAKLNVQPLYAHAGRQCPDLTYYWSDLIVNKNDQQALLAATDEALVCLNLDPSQISTARQMAQQAAQRELSVGEQGTRVTLSVVKALIRRMSTMPGQRLIVLASPGFLAQTAEAISDKADILDAAARANVMISSINARGLFTTEMDASQSGAASSDAQRMISQYHHDSALATEDVLAELADGTGGTFFHNNNDLNLGFARVAEAPEVSYVLGFSPQTMKPDGSFHRLKISMANRSGLNVQARRGYYALKHNANAEEEAKVDIHDAVFSRDEMRDIPVDLQTQFFKTNEVSAKLTVVAKVDLRRLRFKKLNSRNEDDLTIVSVLFDRNGNYVTGMTKIVTMKLRDETLARLTSGITVKTSFDVKPGTYVVRLVVRDAEGQAMAAQNGAVEIP
jgi:VWFA-related protein